MNATEYLNCLSNVFRACRVTGHPAYAVCLGCKHVFEEWARLAISYRGYLIPLDLRPGQEIRPLDADDPEYFRPRTRAEWAAYTEASHRQARAYRLGP